MMFTNLLQNCDKPSTSCFIQENFRFYDKIILTRRVEPCLMGQDPSCNEGMVNVHLPNSNFSNLCSCNFQSSLFLKLNTFFKQYHFL